MSSVSMNKLDEVAEMAEEKNASNDVDKLGAEEASAQAPGETLDDHPNRQHQQLSAKQLEAELTGQSIKRNPPVITALISTTAWIALSAAVFCLWEDWTYFTSFYFFFISTRQAFSTRTSRFLYVSPNMKLPKANDC